MERAEPILRKKACDGAQKVRDHTRLELVVQQNAALEDREVLREHPQVLFSANCTDTGFFAPHLRRPASFWESHSQQIQSACLLQSPREATLMTDLAGIAQQLKKERDRAAKEVHRLDAALAALNGSSYGRPSGGARLSAAARARIAAAQRARWAKVKRGQKANVVTMPKKRTMSAAARRRIAAAQRARWAKVKSAKKTA